MENLNPGYFYIPYGVNSFSLPFAGKLILSAVTTYAKGERRANFSYTTLAEKFHLARPTIAANVKSLKKSNLVHQRKHVGKAATYAYSGDEIKKIGSFRFDYFLLTETFTFRNGTSRRLKGSECLVLALVASYGEGGYAGNVKTMASMLDIAPKTAYNAIRALMSCDLLYRPVRGKNHHATSEFYANLKCVRALRKKHRRAEREMPNMTITYVSQAEKDEVTRIKREEQESLLKQAAADREERVRKYCLQIPEYRAALDAFKTNGALARQLPEGAEKNAAIARQLSASGEIDRIKRQVRDTLFPPGNALKMA